MAKALADRLAEAFAEFLHRRARLDWGYGQEEKLSTDELIGEKYRGIRPAFGYPACPDHTEKRTLFDLLQAEKATGIRLTETFAMWPAAVGQRPLFRASRVPLFLGRPHHPRPGRKLRGTQEDADRRNRALAWSEPGLRAEVIGSVRLTTGK